MSTPYKDIQGPDGLLARMVTFTGNSMHGYAANDPTFVYTVWSYTTIIAEVTRGEDGRFVTDINDSYYSPTTSRHQNLCRSWLPGVPAVTS